MADDINNKTLATLLVIAIIVSIGGTLISLNRLSKFGGVTFATSGTAKVNLTVTSSSGITVTQAIDFGSGYSNASISTNCTMESNLSSGARPDADCKGDWANFISDSTKRYIIVQDTGNTNGNLTINASAVATTWIDTVSTGWSQAWYAALNPTANDGCADANQTIAWTTLSTGAPSALCVNATGTAFTYGTNSILWVAAKVNVPFDATPGEKQTQVGIY
ncbi:MAG: hypothetical protein NTZ02_03625, partial [Candidatus Woesearchaeota archaeon]|nr:hypothetical protein [Candidatus Woesearchaeota archaeon]